jgi:hypothetical protein
VADLFRWAERIGVPVRVAACVCPEGIVEERLGRDIGRQGHPAANRTVGLYRSLKAEAEPLRRRCCHIASVEALCGTKTVPK